MSETTAIILVFITSFLWGTWLQARKYTGTFPLTSFMVWLYFASMVLVLVFAAVYGIFVPSDILGEIVSDPYRAFAVILCGAGLAIGMYIQMNVIDRVGLILANSVSATFGVILGTLLTVCLGGIPENVSMTIVWLSVVILILATFLCQYSGKMRDTDLQRKSVRPEKTQDTKAVFLLILSSILITAYPLGMSIGVKTVSSGVGFSSIACISLLSIGSFLGVFAFCAFPMTKNKEWGTLVSRQYKKEIAISCLCGVCHYGGNLIHVFTASVLSTAISWLLGRLGNMWTYLWGLYHKEYKGASRKTYTMLFCGIGVYIVGIVLLAQSFYS